jgi:transcriptional regulator with GAF, ATPase, and Fis domain
LSTSGQTKLLRFLQDREYRPLGWLRATVADVRVIAATNAEIARRVEAQTFRADPSFRLRTFPIHLPPLRDRKEDSPLLVNHFVQIHSTRMNIPLRAISGCAMEELIHYGWSGNCRYVRPSWTEFDIFCDTVWGIGLSGSDGRQSSRGLC